jgi:hypothetical protein
MLDLMIKSFWWGAWWPVSTWLLMAEKAASFPPRPEKR